GSSSVGDGTPEARAHRVAGELLHRAAVPLDRGPRLLEVPNHDLPYGLRIDPLAKGRRADHVAEEQRRLLAPLGRTRGQRLAATRAKARVVGVFPAALWARAHGGKVRAP